MYKRQAQAKAEALGWDSSYGRTYEQLAGCKIRLKHMLLYCYNELDDEQAELLLILRGFCARRR